VTEHGETKILDFGVAKLLDEDDDSEAEIPTRVDTLFGVTSSGSTVGTIAYMSPEQARGEELDGRSDLFSLGVVLFEMATGKSPFLKASAIATFDSILHQTPISPGSQVCDIPSKLEYVIEKALEKDREIRYQTAREVQTDLKRVKRERSSDKFMVSGFSDEVQSPKKRQLSLSGAVLGGCLVAVVAMLFWWLLPPDTGPVSSIAVLPFSDLSGVAETEFLSETLTESVIDSLSQLPEPELVVMSWSAVSRYGGSHNDPYSIGRELDVDAVLTGKVLQSGEGLTIRVELSNVRNGRHIWGTTYDRRLSELGEVREGIAADITERLRLRLSGEEKDRLEVYRLFQSGKYYLDKRTAEGLHKSIELLRSVIARDPSHAKAYAALANCYSLLPYYGGGSPRDSYPEAKAMAEQALRLDETIPEAHAALGLVKRDFERDWAGAENEFRRAIELNPEYETAHQWYSEYLTVIGRFDEAVTEIERAGELAPFSFIIRAVHGWVLYCAGRIDEAVAELETTLEMDPHYEVAHWFLGQALTAKGEYVEAIKHLNLAIELSGGNPRFMADLGYVYGRSGRKAEAIQILVELDELSDQDRHVSLYGYALVHTALGNSDNAIDALELALDERPWEWEMVMLRVDPMLEDLRHDSRFRRMLRRLGLPPMED
jgi:TolB-like protein/Flp pilus assembly protein TadD